MRVDAPGIGGGDPGTTICAAHPAQVAFEICTRCGGFACVECARPTDSGLLCADCLARTAAMYAGNRTHLTLGLVFSAFGLLCFPLGLGGLLIGAHELWLIHHRRAPVERRRMAWTLTVLGGVGGLVVPFLLFLVWLAVALWSIGAYTARH